jgi:hypothetical protein
MADETVSFTTAGCPQCKESREITIPYLKDQLAQITEQRDRLDRLVERMKTYIVGRELQLFEAETRRNNAQQE